MKPGTPKKWALIVLPWLAIAGAFLQPGMAGARDGIDVDTVAQGRPQALHDVLFSFRVAGSFLAELDLVGTDGTPFSIQALTTLSADGAAVATDTDDFGFGLDPDRPAFFHSPKHGAWTRVGRREIAITLLEFAYDPIGNLTAIYKLNFLGEFRPDFDAGDGTVLFDAFLPNQDPLDPEEQPVATGGGTFSVQRIKAETPD